MTRLEKKLRIILFQPLVEAENYEFIWLHDDSVDKLVDQILKLLKERKENGQTGI